MTEKQRKQFESLFAMQAELASTRWIRITERQPNWGVKVLGCIHRKRPLVIFSLELTPGGYRVEFDNPVLMVRVQHSTDDNNFDGIRYWMELPDPPEYV